MTAKIKFGLEMTLDLEEYTQRLLYFYSNYDERHEITMLGKVLKAGDNFWDIGANIGFYSLVAAGIVGASGGVVAFEPASVAWQSFLANIKLNHYENIIHPFNLAVADSTGEATLYCQPGIADGGASLLAPEKADRGKETCHFVSLSEFYREHAFPRPTFLKIDVEGFEDRVLRGAQEILAGEQPPLLLLGR